MKKITLFYDGSWYTFKWIKSMLWAKNEFRELGYIVSFINEEEYIPAQNKTEIFERDLLNHEYDIVLLAHHDSHIGLCSIEYSKFEYLMKRLKERCNKIVWCDTSDSTGTLWSKAFPFVDLYFKKQTLLDLNKYTNRMWAGRLYTQYYLDKGYINEEGADYDPPVTESDLKKIRLSWNVGLGELFESKEVSYQKPHHIFTPDSIAPSLDRKYDIQYKGTLDYSVCGYQRLRCTELIGKSSLKHSDIFSIIPYKDYLKEIAESKSVVSPYGWGEICTRDFEAFLQGSVLIKPDMSHMTTYPNWYIKNQTYVPIKWDFSDFMDVIEQAKNSKEYIKIAQNAQDLFNYHRNTKMGKREFAEHIVHELER